MCVFFFLLRFQSGKFFRAYSFEFCYILNFIRTRLNLESFGITLFLYVEQIYYNWVAVLFLPLKPNFSASCSSKFEKLLQESCNFWICILKSNPKLEYLLRNSANTYKKKIWNSHSNSIFWFPIWPWISFGDINLCIGHSSYFYNSEHRQMLPSGVSVENSGLILGSIWGKYCEVCAQQQSFMSSLICEIRHSQMRCSKNPTSELT